MEQWLLVLQGTDSEAKAKAIEALETLGPDGVSGLSKAASDGPVEIQARAAEAAGRMGAPGINALVRMLKNEDVNLRRGALEIL